MTNSKIKRIKIPFLIDMIEVSDPETVLAIENSGKVSRLHYYDFKQLPWLIRYFLIASKHYDEIHGDFVIAMDPDGTHNIDKRISCIKEGLDKGFDIASVKKIANLLNENASDDELAYTLINIAMKNLIKAPIPRAVSDKSRCPFSRLTIDIFLPWKYKIAHNAINDNVNYCAQYQSHDVLKPLDIAHSISNVAFTHVNALNLLKNNPHQTLDEIYSKNPLLLSVPRVVTEETTFNGLLKDPAIPKKTIISFMNTKMAHETGKALYNFSTGQKKRRCTYYDFFFKFTKAVQDELISMEKALRK